MTPQKGRVLETMIVEASRDTKYHAPECSGERRVLTSQLQSRPRTTVVPKDAEVFDLATMIALATPAM